MTLSPLCRCPEFKKLLKLTRQAKVSFTKAITDCPQKDLPTVAREAAYVISLATEGFIKHLASACHKAAVRENRTTIKRQDIGLSLSFLFYPHLN